MARNPTVACAENCGRLMWAGPTCVPGQSTCRPCRRIALGQPEYQSAPYRRPGSVPADCAESNCEKPSRVRGLCRNHYHQRFPTPSDLEHARKRNQLKNHVRRGRLRTPEAEMIDRDKVGDRDGWRCGICRRPVDRTKVYPHPRSPSLDHVIPQSHPENGPHTWANVRIAHLDCNVARSNLGGGEQLALFG